MLHMAISHKDQLTIQRANEGLRELSSCLEDLDRLFKRLIIVLSHIDFPKNDLEPIGNKIVAVVTRHFEGDEARRYGAAAVLTAVDGSRIKTEDDLKRALETNIAHSKDLLEAAKEALRERIDKLSGTPAQLPAQVLRPTEVVSIKDISSATSAKKTPLISIKPSFAGVSIDLVELWRRIHGK
jgi:nucleoside-diphosphate-sugar epimerase